MTPKVGDRVTSRYNPKCFCKVVEVRSTAIIMEVLLGSHFDGKQVVDAKDDWHKHWKLAA